MIKKMISVLLLAFLIGFTLPLLYAAEKKTSRGITLVGMVGDVLDISLSPIAVSSDTDVTGMPFSITDLSVRPYVTNPDSMLYYSPAAYGRVIGTWTLVSNCDFTISIDAQPMKHTDDPNVGALGYMLFLDADFSYVDATGRFRESTGMIVAGTDIETRFLWPGMGTFSTNRFSDYVVDAEVSSYTGVINGEIAFCFTEDGWERANTEATPPGYYRAYATITVESTV